MEDKFNFDSLHMITTPELNRGECGKICRILIKNNINVFRTIYSDNRLENYYPYLFFMREDSGGNKNIVHGCSQFYNHRGASHKHVSIEIFINSILKERKKFDIYGKPQGNMEVWAW